MNKQTAANALIVIAFVAIGFLATVFIGQLQDRKPVAIERPFYCTTPYSLDYCHANQDTMYQIKAQRER